MEEMEKVKKEKFEMGKWLNDILFRCIIDLFREFERMAMGKYVYRREIGGLAPELWE